MTLHSGDRLDHYRIEALVARSGMASIYRGTDTRSGRQVAIKIPHPEVESDPALFDRFHREEEIGKILDHPGVMKVFAVRGVRGGRSATQGDCSGRFFRRRPLLGQSGVG